VTWVFLIVAPEREGLVIDPVAVARDEVDEDFYPVGPAGPLDSSWELTCGLSSEPVTTWPSDRDTTTSTEWTKLIPFPPRNVTVMVGFIATVFRSTCTSTEYWVGSGPSRKPVGVEVTCVGEVGMGVAVAVTGGVVATVVGEVGVTCPPGDGCVHPAMQTHRTTVMPIRIESVFFMHRSTSHPYKRFPSAIHGCSIPKSFDTMFIFGMKID